MAVFQHILWGYELTYPDDWLHQHWQGAEIFRAKTTAPESPEADQDAGQVQVRSEWNWARQPIEPLWNRHVGMLASMLGAKEIGSAPWRFGDAAGLEAEIVLPKRDNRRLWMGILMRDFRVLQFMATHPKEAREQFEPIATRLIASLRFPNRIAGIQISPEGLPLPPGYEPVDPQSILSDITDPQQWRAYAGEAEVGALQAFYLRELPIHHWDMEEYVPFPGSTDLGFARLQLRRGNLRLTLGMMPVETTETEPGSTLARIVFKMSAS